MHTVKVHKKGKLYEFQVEEGTNLLKFLRKNSLEVSSPCGGHGTCGKCRLKLKGLHDISEKEKKLLGMKAFEKGYRLACFCSVKADIEVFLDNKTEEASIMTDTISNSLQLSPIIRKEAVNLLKPSIEDQCPDLERLLKHPSINKALVSLDLLKDLPAALREFDYKATLGFMDKRLIFVEGGDTASKLYGIAVDIGTTTIAAYFYDLNSGSRLDVYSCLNPQRKYGADVLSRIDHVINQEEGLKEINNEIVSCINGIINHFCENNSILRSDIYNISFVGNTTMIHLLLGVSPRNIAFAPFIPAFTELLKIKAEELGLIINKYGYATILPSVSAYVGADTIGAILSSRIYDSRKISLLIDIGTNGEIVLGNSSWLYACSTAAGPAFEGANIRNGVGGIKGAIDSIRLLPEISFTTIGKEAPIGLCGSGVVDGVAEMLKAGIIDETGRIDTENEDLPEELQKRIKQIEGANSFLIYGCDTCHEEIYITQKDVRELQNAKAAIAAGIKVLAKHAGIDLMDIDRVYLAGGFGSYINIESALKIGLIPHELRGRITATGNAAGAGAIECLLSAKAIKRAAEIKKRVKYIELSSRADFTSEYVESMLF